MRKKRLIFLIAILYLFIFDIISSADGRSVRSKNSKKSKKSKTPKVRTEPEPVIDVGLGQPDSGLRRAFVRFLKDSLRKMERKDSDKQQVKLAVGVPLGLVTAYGIYADFCDEDTKHPLCALPGVIVPKISSVTQRLFGMHNIFQRVKNLFYRS